MMHSYTPVFGPGPIFAKGAGGETGPRTDSPSGHAAGGTVGTAKFRFA